MGGRDIFGFKYNSKGVGGSNWTKKNDIFGIPSDGKGLSGEKLANAAVGALEIGGAIVGGAIAAPYVIGAGGAVLSAAGQAAGVAGQVVGAGVNMVGGAVNGVVGAVSATGKALTSLSGLAGSDKATSDSISNPSGGQTPVTIIQLPSNSMTPVNTDQRYTSPVNDSTMKLLDGNQVLANTAGPLIQAGVSAPNYIPYIIAAAAVLGAVVIWKAIK